MNHPVTEDGTRLVYDDLAGVMTGLDLHGATLVSHSMGSGETVRYLARHGADRVARRHRHVPG